jgi:hypothetical protein
MWGHRGTVLQFVCAGYGDVREGESPGTERGRTCAVCQPGHRCRSTRAPMRLRLATGARSFFSRGTEREH